MRQASRLQQLSPNHGSGDLPALLIFHHAGGSALSFGAFTRALKDSFEIRLAELPGRGLSHLEPPAESLRGFARSLGPEIAAWLGSRPCVFFGHSMGALLAYEALLAPECAGLAVKALVVSACAAPGRPHGPATLRDSGISLDENALLEAMKAYGPLPKALENAQARAYFLPFFAADLQLLRSYEPGTKKVSFPIEAFLAENDPIVEASAMRAWEGYTESVFALRKVRGGHFYPLEDPAYAASVLRDFLSGA